MLGEFFSRASLKRVANSPVRSWPSVLSRIEKLLPKITLASLKSTT